jgi:putative DNA primase/helicase
MVVIMICNGLVLRKQTPVRGVPRWLQPNPEKIPAELRELDQWVLWRGIWRHGKRTKIPFQPNGELASTVDPHTWGSFGAVVSAWSPKPRRFDGIGLVLSVEDPYTGIDLDRSRDSTTRTIATWALNYIAQFDSYTELSPGGNVRMFIKGTLPGTGRRKGPVELYDRKRFLTITGRHIETHPTTIEPRQDVLDRLLKQLFPQPQRPASLPPSHPSSLADAEVIRRASVARNGTRFLSLYRDGLTGGDWSAADFELLCLLLFWCGGDSAQALRLFCSSALAQRPKWQQRDDYRQRTVNAALNRVAQFYEPQIVSSLRIVNA